MRSAFLKAYALIMSRTPLQISTSFVMTGANGWLFFRGDYMVQQSAGLIRRNAELATVVNLLATMHSLLDARGIRLLVASPPNTTTIYQEYLPLWGRNRGQRTEYDVLLDDLTARGIQAIDLRPAVMAAKAGGKVYRMHDTHWTPRGAVAAFNAIVQADRHPDWKLDPTAVLGPPEISMGGDLARLTGDQSGLTEQIQPLTLPKGKREALDTQKSFSTVLATGDRSGPTIMIIGDSFTENDFPPLLLHSTGPVVWVYFDFCKFDWKWVDQLHPDEVWWMPSERYDLCSGGRWPVDLPKPAGAGG
jgi:hypothetical protein